MEKNVLHTIYVLLRISEFRNEIQMGAVGHLDCWYDKYLSMLSNKYISELFLFKLNNEMATG